MEKHTPTGKEKAEAANCRFEEKTHHFLQEWALTHEHRMLLKFDQPLEKYLANDALRDFFLTSRHPLQKLLEDKAIAAHLGRRVKAVYFDPLNGDPLLAATEQRIYNLARRMDSEHMHVPFRSVHPNKQTETGDTACISTYETGSEEIRYNSGNHFISRPANINVFDVNSKRYSAGATGNLHILFKRGFMEDRLHEVRTLTDYMKQNGETRPQFFLIYSRHSAKEGHFGVSLVIMDPVNPEFPQRVMVCDTLLKELPHHPRWWNHFVDEYTNVFGEAIKEIIEDLSHPLQKVNVKGDDPYRHDWDCPYYALSMANALAYIATNHPDVLLTQSTDTIHCAMKAMMPDYYQPDQEIKSREDIRAVNRMKRWKSGREMIKNLAAEVKHKSSYEW